MARAIARDIGFDKKGDVTVAGYVFCAWNGGKYAYVK
jgi:hypothetical protein